MKKEIILFRFHKKPLVVKNRIKLLKKFNPELDIYGLYGGKEEDFKSTRRYLRKDFKNIYKLKPNYDLYHWHNGDLAVLEWYKNYSKKIDFKKLYLVEWDALIFTPLKDVYKNIPDDVLGLTWLNNIEDIKERWYWTSNNPWKTFWIELLERVKRKYKYSGDEKVCIFGLPVIPKKFLEDYAKIKIETIKYKEKRIALCHDEIRLPLYAEILGYKMVDTGILPKTKNEENRVFNANNIEIEKNIILNELKKKNGRRTFHPYRKMFNDVKLH